MWVEEFVSQGHAEPVKGAFHGLAAVVCGLMFAYNTTAWLFRREPHLAMNALVYGTDVTVERLAAAWRSPLAEGGGDADVGGAADV